MIAGTQATRSKRQDQRVSGTAIPVGTVTTIGNVRSVVSDIPRPGMIASVESILCALSREMMLT